MVLALAAIGLVLVVALWWRWRRDWRIPASEYQAYIASAAWSRRKRRWKRALRVVLLPWRKRCRACWARDVQMHHRTYRRLGHELHRDLVPLCRTHHERVTAMHHVPGVSVEAATRAYLRQGRVRALTAAPAVPMVLAAAVLLPHLR